MFSWSKWPLIASHGKQLNSEKKNRQDMHYHLASLWHGHLELAGSKPDTKRCFLWTGRNWRQGRFLNATAVTVSPWCSLQVTEGMSWTVLSLHCSPYSFYSVNPAQDACWVPGGSFRHKSCCCCIKVARPVDTCQLSAGNSAQRRRRNLGGPWR